MNNYTKYRHYIHPYTRIKKVGYQCHKCDQHAGQLTETVHGMLGDAILYFRCSECGHQFSVGAAQDGGDRT